MSANGNVDKWVEISKVRRTTSFTHQTFYIVPVRIVSIYLRMS